jgi:DinB superfamily
MASPFTNPPGHAPAQASAYVRSILALLGERDPVEAQSQLVAKLRTAIAGLTADAMNRPEAPGKWSIAQVIRHLADSEVVCGWRLRLVLGQDRPAVTGYDQDSWAQRLAGAYPDVEAALRVLEALRSSHVALLRSLKPADWEREGIHAERGPESVRMIAKLYAGHDLAHLNQIARIRKVIG